MIILPLLWCPYNLVSIIIRQCSHHIEINRFVKKINWLVSIWWQHSRYMDKMNVQVLLKHSKANFEHVFLARSNWNSQSMHYLEYYSKGKTEKKTWGNWLKINLPQSNILRKVLKVAMQMHQYFVNCCPFFRKLMQPYLKAIWPIILKISRKSSFKANWTIFFPRPPKLEFQGNILTFIPN